MSLNAVDDEDDDLINTVTICQLNIIEDTGKKMLDKILYKIDTSEI